MYTQDNSHQQPEVNYLPLFGPQLTSLEESTLRVYFSGEIDLFENLDIVHITMLVVRCMDLCRSAVVPLLLQQGAEISDKGNEGKTPR